MTALTDRRDRACLSGLALVGLGLLLAISFIWLRLAVVRSPSGDGEPWPAAAVANHAAAALLRADQAGTQTQQVRR